MTSILLPDEPRRAAELVCRADIVIGIPSYNNSKTIGHVVQAAYAGLAKYFPQFTGVIINCDEGSTDNTRQAVLSGRIDDSELMLFSASLRAGESVYFPYQGVPEKGSALRRIFQIAAQLQVKACAVLNSDLRCITPEWIDLLLRPILFAGYDFVAPFYHRHKYGGTMTTNVVYPLMRALYGLRVRHAIGGDFGLSARLCTRYLTRDDWDTRVTGHATDLWMTTIAMAEGFRVCQSFLGTKLHNAKDPRARVSRMLQQVVGGVFLLMQEYEPIWKIRKGSQPAELFGFRYDLELDPIEVDVRGMVNAFRRGCREMGEVWERVLRPQTLSDLKQLATDGPGVVGKFHLEDDLWIRVLFDFASAHNLRTLPQGALLSSLTPLYLGRVASFVIETRPLIATEVEQKIDQLCMKFEDLKPYLLEQWNQDLPAAYDPLFKKQARVKEAAPSARVEA